MTWFCYETASLMHCHHRFNSHLFPPALFHFHFCSFTMTLSFANFTLSPWPFIMALLLFHHAPFFCHIYSFIIALFLMAPLLFHHAPFFYHFYARPKMTNMSGSISLKSISDQFLPVPTCSQRPIFLLPPKTNGPLLVHRSQHETHLMQDCLV